MSDVTDGTLDILDCKAAMQHAVLELAVPEEQQVATSCASRQSITVVLSPRFLTKTISQLMCNA